MPYKFTPDRWIIFDYQSDKTAIGRTAYQGSRPMVVFTSEEGDTGTLPFERVVRPRRLFLESRASNNLRKSIGRVPDVLIGFRTGKA